MTLYRCTQKGHIGTEEIWNTTIHVNDASGNAGTILSAFATAVTGLWTNPGTPADSIQQYVATTVGVDELLVDELDGSGKNVAQAFGTLAIAGTSVNASLPPEVSVCVSTRSASPTRAGRGRFYLPPFVVTTVDGFRLDPTIRDHVAGGAQLYVQTLSDATLTGAVIWTPNTGISFKIISIDVGDVYDSQRRRRDKMNEERISLPIT